MQSLIAKKWKSLGFQPTSDSKIYAPSPLQKRGRITILNLFSSSIIRFMFYLFFDTFLHIKCAKAIFNIPFSLSFFPVINAKIINSK